MGKAVACSAYVNVNADHLKEKTFASPNLRKHKSVGKSEMCRRRWFPDMNLTFPDFI